MNKGLAGYETTIFGMLHKLKQIETITKNIENATTVGYKRQIPESLTFKTIFDQVALRDESQADLKKTSNNFDLAIEGNAYFLVEGEDGPIPARNGNFRLNEKGELSTQDGKEVVVLDKTEKPVSLATTNDIKVNENGEIFANGEKYGRIAMQIMDNKPVRIHQGFVEGSNVNLATEMMSLTMAFRAFEASEKTLGMEASVDKDLIEKYGRNV